MKAIVFDAFGTLFKVTSGGSARTIMNNITDNSKENYPKKVNDKLLNEVSGKEAEVTIYNNYNTLIF